MRPTARPRRLLMSLVALCTLLSLFAVPPVSAAEAPPPPLPRPVVQRVDPGQVASAQRYWTPEREREAIRNTAARDKAEASKASKALGPDPSPTEIHIRPGCSPGLRSPGNSS